MRSYRVQHDGIDYAVTASPAGQGSVYRVETNALVVVSPVMTGYCDSCAIGVVLHGIPDILEDFLWDSVYEGVFQCECDLEED